MNPTTSPRNAPVTTHDVAAIEGWLRTRLCGPLRLTGPEAVDLRRSAEDLALDSMNVVRLAGELEEWLGIELEPSLIYEYESLAAFARQMEVMHRKASGRRGDTGRPFRVALAATFTAEPVGEALGFALGRLGYSPEILFAPYHQVFQELLNPSGVLGSNRDGTNVVLVRVEDWFRFGTDVVDPAKASATVDDFVAALRTHASAGGARLLLVLCPHGGSQVRRLGLTEVLDALDERILDAAKPLPGVRVLDLRDPESLRGVRRVHDESRDHLGHIPFTPEFFNALGLEVARRAFTPRHAPVKVLVVDCDNTLWRGVVGEDGPLGIEITPGHARLQDFLVRQQREGRLLCLASKNNEADVWEVFDRNPAMRLRREHIVSARIDWSPKSGNILDLASELRLGLDGFVFLDDSPTECEEVRSAIPDVLVVRVPEDPSRLADFLDGHWAFDAEGVTAEDRERTRMYRENLQREAVRSSARSFESFIAQLDVRVEIAAATGDEVPRIAQLTQRTNQFNATSLRRDEAAVGTLLREPAIRVRTVRVKDRFGDYGLVGLLVAQPDAPARALVCESFLMSCRVLGKRVEQAMVEHLAAIADSLGLEAVHIRFAASEKNRPVRDFLESLGEPWSSVEDASTMQEIRLPLGKVAAAVAASRTEHTLPSNPAASNPAPAAAAAGAGSDRVRLSDVAQGLEALARLHGDPAALQAEMRSRNRVRRGDLATPFVAPRTAWQRKIAAIWAEVLGVDRVGIHDGFFDLGGDSLRAAEAFARMWEIGAPESISLVNASEVTVAGVAGAIEEVKAGREARLTTVRTSLDDEGRVPGDVHAAAGALVLAEPMMRRVFLTGATGYLGAFLLAELMRQATVDVTCLVRAASPAEGRRRVVANLSRYGLWDDSWTVRVGIVLGELSEPRFGLSEERFRTLAADHDTIFHSGAWVNFVFPYERLRPSHVDAMEHVMRLATANPDRVLNLHFISTLGVIMSTGYARGSVVPEDGRLQHVEGLLNGYEQAKHVADRMAWTGMKERGIPTAIYRPGMVGGDGVTGEYHKLDEFLSSFYKGCIQLGAMPLLESTWEVIPVDFLTRVIVHGARREGTLGHVYHSLHPEPTPVADYIRWFNESGYPMRALPWAVWKSELMAQGPVRLKENALFPFVDFIRALTDEQVRFPATDKSNWKRLVSASGLACPGQRDVLGRYLAHFAKVGFLQSPRPGSARDPRSLIQA